MLKSIKKNYLSFIVALTTLMLGSVASVQAAVPEAITTELATLKTDVGTLGAAAFIVFLVILSFIYFRRVTK